MADDQTSAVAPRAGPQDALRLAESVFMAGRKIDMNRLAAGLGVDRTTLFRWVGNRDQLLSSVLVSRSEAAMERAISLAGGEGGTRVAEIAALYAGLNIDSGFFRSWLQTDPERGLRLVAGPGSAVQQYIVATFERLLDEEISAGRIVSSMPTYDLAYVVVRLIESFVYSDVITGVPPEGDKVGIAVGALLSS